MNAPVRTGSVSAAPALRIQGLTCRYGDGPAAVDNLSFDVARGEFVGLLGPSGCGKSTTLRAIAGLVPASAGDVTVEGESLLARPAWDRNLGLVFQNYALFPHMSVAENVAFGLKLRKVGRGEIARRVAEALKIVRLDAFGERRPTELSGGQQQRVAIARAIVIEPDILLLDEPLSNLDAKLRDEMRVEIREIQRRVGITTLFVTHDQEEALTMCDRIAVMRDGRLEQIGAPREIYDRAATPFVASFIGRANRLDCELRRDGRPTLVCRGLALPTPERLPPGDALLAMVRPHVIRVTAAGAGALSGRVVRRAFIGNAIEATVAVSEDLSLNMEERPSSPGDALLAEGAEVGLDWDPAHMLVFPR